MEFIKKLVHEVVEKITTQPLKIIKKHHPLKIQEAHGFKLKELQIVPDNKDSSNVLGIFIALSGILTLLEMFSVISSDMKWGMPLMFTCLGFSIIFDSFKAKQNQKQKE